MPYYDYALDIILDVETPQDELLTEDQQELVHPLPSEEGTTSHLVRTFAST